MSAEDETNGANDGAPLKMDVEAIQKLAEVVRDTGASELEYEDSTRRIRVARETATQVVQAQIPADGGQPAAPAPQPAPAAQPGQAGQGADASAPAEPEDWSKHPGAVTSPMVGTAYLGPAPDKPPYVREGDQVEKDQTLLIIEAMKVMNPIRAPRGGTVRHIAVGDAMPVEYGEVLMVIE